MIRRQMLGVLDHHSRRPRHLVLRKTLEQSLRDEAPPTFKLLRRLGRGAAARLR